MLHYNILYVGTVTVEGRFFWHMYMRVMRRSGGIIPRLTAKQVTLNYAMLVFLTIVLVQENFEKYFLTIVIPAEEN